MHSRIKSRTAVVLASACLGALLAGCSPEPAGDSVESQGQNLNNHVYRLHWIPYQGCAHSITHDNTGSPVIIGCDGPGPDHPVYRLDDDQQWVRQGGKGVKVSGTGYVP